MHGCAIFWPQTQWKERIQHIQLVVSCRHLWDHRVTGAVDHISVLLVPPVSAGSCAERQHGALSGRSSWIYVG